MWTRRTPIVAFGEPEPDLTLRFRHTVDAGLIKTKPFDVRRHGRRPSVRQPGVGLPGIRPSVRGSGVAASAARSTGRDGGSDREEHGHSFCFSKSYNVQVSPPAKSLFFLFGRKQNAGHEESLRFLQFITISPLVSRLAAHCRSGEH